MTSQASSIALMEIVRPNGFKFFRFDLDSCLRGRRELSHSDLLSIPAGMPIIFQSVHGLEEVAQVEHPVECESHSSSVSAKPIVPVVSKWS